MFAGPFFGIDPKIGKMTVESSISLVNHFECTCKNFCMYLSRYVCLCLCVYLSMFLWVSVCVCVFMVSLFIVLSFCVQNIL